MRIAPVVFAAAAIALIAGPSRAGDLPETHAALTLPQAEAPLDLSFATDIRPKRPKINGKAKMANTGLRSAKSAQPQAIERAHGDSGSLRSLAEARAAERSVALAQGNTSVATADAAIGPADTKRAAAPAAGEAKPSAATAEARKGLAADYCGNIVDAAAEARAAWQVKKIGELEAELTEQIRKLEEKRQEYQDWFQKQELARRKAEDSVVAIFSRMRPDAAAAQLSVMEESSAASILAKMNARVSSVILNEMTPGKAAKLADSMAPQSGEGGKAAARGAIQ
jgi:flagellar motility protein MotE (MotC chaperone)